MTSTVLTPTQTAAPPFLMDRQCDHARDSFDALACVLVAEDSVAGAEEVQLTYASVNHELWAVATGLRVHLVPDDRVLRLDVRIQDVVDSG